MFKLLNPFILVGARCAFAFGFVLLVGLCVCAVGSAPPGDLNHDGLVNALDAPLLSAAIAGGDPAADCNRDGRVNALDIAACTRLFSEPPATQPGVHPFQARLDALPPTNGLIRGDGEIVRLTGPLNFRGLRDATLRDLELQFQLPAPGGLLCDLTDASELYFDNVTIRCVGAHPADVGLLLARAAQDGRSAGSHRFQRVRVLGNFRVAHVVNHGSENCVWAQCTFGKNNLPGARGYLSQRTPTHGVISPFGEFGGGSNINHYLTFCNIGLYGEGAVNVELGDHTRYVLLLGGSWSNKRGGRAALLISGRADVVVWEMVQAESYGVPATLEVAPAAHCGVLTVNHGMLCHDGLAIVGRDRVDHLDYDGVGDVRVPRLP